MKTKLALLLAFLVTYCFNAAWAAEVVIPDAALKAAIWETLGREQPVGNLTEVDMLSLTNLDAGNRGVRTLDGLGAARNLITLDLYYNQLTSLTLPDGLTSLTRLELFDSQLTSLTLPAGLTNLTMLDLGRNQLTNLTLPDGLTRLTTLLLHENHLTSLTLANGIPGLATLYLQYNQLTNLTLPAGLTNLVTLELGYNELTSLTLPDSLTSLITLSLCYNQLTNLMLPAGLTNLGKLQLGYNELTSLTLPDGLTSLNMLELGDNQLTSLTLGLGLISLTTLDLSGGATSTEFALYGDVSHLTKLDLKGPVGIGCCGPIRKLTLPAGLTNLTTLDVRLNQLTSLSLPADLTSLINLSLGGNPLQFVVLPEPLALGALAGLVADLVGQGVSVSIYVPGLRLLALPWTQGKPFELLLNGPTGTYRVQGTQDFSTWTDLAPVTLDANGSVTITNPSANIHPHRFYRALRAN